MLIKQTAWLCIALFCLACSSWYFAKPAKITQLDPQTLATTADTIITDLTIHEFDTTGNQVSYLRSPLVHHIPEDNTHWLKSPHIIIAQENQADWEIDSEEATALHGGQQITFEKHVVIHQDQNEHKVPSTFKTESLTYYPKEKFATTLEKVTFIQPGQVVEATGMNAYLAEKRVQLLSKTRGIYEPKKP